jgi:hypothetical protein
MIDGLRPYQEYKETGLDWLDGLPSHWEELSLKKGEESRKKSEIVQRECQSTVGSYH